MILCVGLGNPIGGAHGESFRFNRHNFGVLVIEKLLADHAHAPLKQKFQGLLAEISFASAASSRSGTEHSPEPNPVLAKAARGTVRTLVLLPQTFMNRSGLSASACAQFYKIAPQHIVAFHDELDLPLGKIRVKQGGGDAGHNGLRSLTDHFGANYWRVRLGIGHPGDKSLVHAYVLGNFGKAERAVVDALASAISSHMADFCGALMQGNGQSAASLLQNRVDMGMKALGQQVSSGIQSI